MSYWIYLKKALKIILLDKKTVIEVAQDTKANYVAIFFLIIGFVSTSIVYLIKPLPVWYILVIVLGSVIELALIHLLARLFGSKEHFLFFFKPLMLSSIWCIFSFLTLIPIVGIYFEIISIVWGFIIFFAIIKWTYKLTTFKTAAVLFFMFLIIIFVGVFMGLGYGILVAMQDPTLFTNAIDQTVYNESLNVGAVQFGEYFNQDCINPHNNTFIKSDRICLHLFNISAFNKSSEGLSKFETYAEIIGKSGELISKNTIISGKEGEVLLKNNFLDAGVILRTDDFEVGEYVLFAYVYDLIGKKKISINRSFKIVDESYFGKLNIWNITVGEDIGYECLRRNEPVFFTHEALCIKPEGVTGFQTNAEGLNWFDMDLIITNNEGEIVEYLIQIFKDEGKIRMFENTLNGKWARISLTDYVPGNYTLALTIQDRISRKRVTVSRSFVVEAGLDDLGDFAYVTEGILELGETKLITLLDRAYEISLKNVSSGRAIFQVGGIESEWLSEGELFMIQGNYFLRRSEIYPQNRVRFIVYKKLQ